MHVWNIYIYLSIYLSSYLPTYLPTYLPIYLVEATTTQLCPDTVNQLSYKAMSPTCTQSTFIWKAKWTRTRMRFHFGWKSTLVFSHLFTCIHINWGKLKIKLVWISYWSLWLMKFQTSDIFMRTKFTQSKMNKRGFFGYCISCACAFESQCRCYFITSILPEI